MSAENHTLVPEPPAFLPALTDVEEILIARIKVAIQVWLVKGAQWKYTGHVVNFMRDTGKIYRKLPTPIPFNSPPAYISFRGSARSALPQSGYSRRSRPPYLPTSKCL